MKHRSAAAALLLAFSLGSTAGAADFTVASKDVAPGKTVAQDFIFGGFGCTGKNLSPQLHWTGAPAGTQSFAVNIYDPDAPTGSGWWHWVGINLPATTTSLAQGAGAADAATPRPAYRPENVGNDASARPWERSQTAFDGSAGRGVVIGSALSSDWSVPAGFDADGFLKAAKSNFILLQAAWDKADMATLRAMMTDEMLDEISAQLAEREQHTGGAVNLTEVQMLQAQLLGIEELGGEYMASVEFSGMIREDRNAGPSPFREVWNMTKPKDGSRGWLVAGVQALQ